MIHILLSYYIIILRERYPTKTKYRVITNCNFYDYWEAEGKELLVLHIQNNIDQLLCIV